jgi:hypothetical protein
VKVAKKVREEYSKTMKGDAEIWKELQLTFTTREGIQIVQDFNFTKNIKQSIENILLPKISDFDQKAYAKSIIEQIIPTKK